MKPIQKIAVLSALLMFLSYQGYSQNSTASSKEGKTAQAEKMTAGKFVDNDKDGVCDNYQARNKSGRGQNFIDKNGDGVCDNKPNAGNGRGNRNGCGYGNQHRHGQGHGNCCGRGNGFQYRHGQGN